ncbi:MAG: hypothetical protein GXN98_03095 [Euryarchaeota archaeon]|nr:hypothetical protein [Euryarchaeota archaeon]
MGAVNLRYIWVWRRPVSGGKNVRDNVSKEEDASIYGVVLGVYLPLSGLAFSYRRVEAFLENLGFKRSYEAAKQWGAAFRL